MNQTNEGNIADAPLDITVKRKRGRPRKDQSLKRGEKKVRVPPSLNRGESSHVPPSLHRVEGAHVPPTSQVLNENQPRQVDPISGANGGTVGQAVKGVIEAVFDAGYLLAVRIGNSSTYLRGIVFRPGHYAPISAVNDVAPHVQMIKRNEIHIPKEKRSSTHGRNGRSRQRKKQRVDPSENGTSLLLNGLTNQLQELAPETAKLMASRAKHLPMVADASVPPVSTSGTLIPNQNNYPVRSESVQNGNVASHRGTSEVLHGEEVKLARSTGLSMDDEIHGRVKVSSQVSELHMENRKAAGKSLFPEGGTGNMNAPLVTEPLQTIYYDFCNTPTPAPKPLEIRTGRMTALLQALQESVTENQVPRVEDQATVSGLEPQEPLSPETDIEDDEATPSQ